MHHVGRPLLPVPRRLLSSTFTSLEGRIPSESHKAMPKLGCKFHGCSVQDVTTSISSRSAACKIYCRICSVDFNYGPANGFQGQGKGRACSRFCPEQDRWPDTHLDPFYRFLLQLSADKQQHHHVLRILLLAINLSHLAWSCND